VEKLLQVVLPDKLSQAAIALEMLLDLNTTPVEEVIGRLRVFEQRIQPEVKQITESLGCLFSARKIGRLSARLDSSRSAAIPASSLAGTVSAAGKDVGVEAGTANPVTAHPQTQGQN